DGIRPNRTVAWNKRGSVRLRFREESWKLGLFELSSCPQVGFGEISPPKRASVGILPGQLNSRNAEFEPECLLQRPIDRAAISDRACETVSIPNIRLLWQNSDTAL